MKWVYVTCLGETPEAVYGPLWALVERGIKPSKIHVLYTEGVKWLLDKVKKQMAIVAETSDDVVEATEVDETDIEDNARTVREIVERYKAEGFKVSVDVTPGRKPMSIATFQGAIDGQADLVTYLHLMMKDFERKPYPLIPRSVAKLVLLKGVGSWVSPKPPLVENHEYVEIDQMEIYPFINLLCEAIDRNTIAIEIPYLDLKLLTLRLEHPNPKVEYVVDEKTFNENLKNKGLLSAEAFLPFGNERKHIFLLFRDALIASGVVDIGHRALIDEIKREVEEGALRRGFAAVAVDTNALYMRVVTNYVLSFVEASRLKVLVSNIVVREALAPHTLKEMVKEKEWVEESDKIKSLALKVGTEALQLPVKAEPLRSRLSRLAAIELKELQERTNVMIVSSVSGRGDLALIESYKQSPDNPIFITGDVSAANVAETVKLRTYLISYDVSVSREVLKITYTNFPRLIFNLATLLTMISIRVPKTRIEVHVLGAWRDMITSWSKPTILVRAPNPIHEKARQLIEKARRLQSL
ncbi:MAG: hypothetical protein QW794_00965 [Thermosphaera sp.]